MATRRKNPYAKLTGDYLKDYGVKIPPKPTDIPSMVKLAQMKNTKGEK